MAAKKVSKKKYLKILNKRLHAEPNTSPSALFVFYPPGAKAKHATGVSAGESTTKHDLATMTAIQHEAASEFIITDEAK